MYSSFFVHPDLPLRYDREPRGVPVRRRRRRRRLFERRTAQRSGLGS